MKNKIQIFFASLLVCGSVAVLSTVQAQTTDTNTNTIQEVKLYKNDAFTEIREMLIDNFDFTNGDYKQGVVNSEVKFEIAPNGKIVNVRSKGDCKNVSKEIENVLRGSYYKTGRKTSTADLMAYTYVMPVTLEIDNR
ncbi:hypothetical protein SD427_09995 [Chryseobacterium sp. JJR-5R]|uniref:hypothetical protein n=1 Tax=Chryseobacterium sp. JJR-5R TaxID=3093923 RepID=UPI002A759482|nr:hypothetical protein [Chryseobacterium sp. JJR-5R]WPO81092.1 hypothetical protein SD427_09995 [Chryseobacterium sp. JJR-5R]